MNDWINIETQLPREGDTILARFRGCKIGEIFLMTVREGEGLSHIIEWKLVGDKGQDCGV
ncbi:MAG: hypothetical protein LLG04_19040 [Parachlamydia sp.]|nr:hypothetical protein [Parachlamydia sp.]